MALRPDIIMAGRQPNMVNVLANSAQAAGMQNEVVKQNRLAQLYNEQGPAIMSGDKNALNAYAKISPEAALGVQGARMDMDVQSARLEQLRFQTKTAMEELVQTRGLEEAAQIAAERARVVKAALAAPDQQSLDTYLAQNGMEEWIGTITTENRDMYASEFIDSMSDVIETFGPKEPEDRKYAEDAQGLKRYVDTGELVFPNDVPKPMQRPTQKAADGYLYYTDGKKERVFPDVQAKEDTPLIVFQDGTTSNEGTGGGGGQANTGYAPGAFGTLDYLLNIGNAVTDSLIGWEFRPQSAEAATVIGDNANRAMLVGAANFPGRPSNLTRERLENTLPQPGLRGDANALRKARGTVQFFEEGIAAAELSLKNPDLTGNAQMELVQFLSAAKPLLKFYKKLESDLQAYQSGETPTVELPPVDQIPVSSIQSMSVDELKAFDLENASDEQVSAWLRRRDELNK